MTRALDYTTHAPEIPALIAQVNRYLRSSGLDIGLQHLVLLRVSQINQCAYCVDLHSHEALRDGEAMQRITCLPVWQECDFYSEVEKAALAWAEALTRLDGAHQLDAAHAAVSQHFDPKGMSDLSFLIATMNAWNRMGVGHGRSPAKRKDTRNAPA